MQPVLNTAKLNTILLIIPLSVCKPGRYFNFIVKSCDEEYQYIFHCDLFRDLRYSITNLTTLIGYLVTFLFNLHSNIFGLLSKYTRQIQGQINLFTKSKHKCTVSLLQISNDNENNKFKTGFLVLLPLILPLK